MHVKQGKRYIRNSVLALLGVTVLLAAASRLYASTVDGNTPQWLRWMVSLGLAVEVESKPETVANTMQNVQVRDFGAFTAVSVEGDFAVEVIRGPVCKATMVRAVGGPAWDLSVVKQEDGTLRFQRDAGRAEDVLQIQAPTLTSIHAHDLRQLTLRGWKVSEFTIHVKDVADIRLEDSAVERWILRSETPVMVHADKSTLSAGLTIHASGQISFRDAGGGKIDVRGNRSVIIRRTAK
jgi:hypothetical protein